MFLIGVGSWGGGGGARFRILGGGGGGANSQQAHDVVRHVPTRFLINQCQIITLIILKSDIIENSRIELRGIVLPVPSNQMKVTFIIILPFSLVHLANYWGGGAGAPLPPPPLFLRLCSW